MVDRSVKCRASRIVKRFASVAVRANCQEETPNRRVSSAATQSASSVGSISVIPLADWSITAFSVGAGAWPVMAPVSPRQKSTYSIPSTSTNRAPSASSTKTGNPPGHLRIQCIGTPSKSKPRARSASSRERGWVSTKRASSRACSSARPLTAPSSAARPRAVTTTFECDPFRTIAISSSSSASSHTECCGQFVRQTSIASG